MSNSQLDPAGIFPVIQKIRRAYGSSFLQDRTGKISCRPALLNDRLPASHSSLEKQKGHGFFTHGL